MSHCDERHTCGNIFIAHKFMRQIVYLPYKDEGNINQRN